ncbi:MAG: phosphoribosylglycinamide formyltransferase [Candidatus Marinarcus sp.]|uniref:phosphoribosylglycinamide formyltransferase n=1 Tax=Candidatus Marinarcus sp. TaxID=3100987 RepID=UPI003AFF64FD
MIRLGILSSHNGSGFDTIQEACENKELHAEIVVVISNNSNAEVLKKAASKEIPHFIINANLFPNEDLDEKITSVLNEHACDYLFLSGYMKKLEKNLIQTYENRIINSHPALLPKFGGVGMYGRNVHDAVIKAKEKQSGCTVHFVNEEYDKGEFILQKSITLDENESAESLEQKIKELEAVAIIEALNKLFNQ